MTNQNQVSIDVSNIENLKCECGCEIWTPCFYIKIVSELLSPTGKEIAANIPDFQCDECGLSLSNLMKQRSLLDKIH